MYNDCALNLGIYIYINLIKIRILCLQKFTEPKLYYYTRHAASNTDELCSTAPKEYTVL